MPVVNSMIEVSHAVEDQPLSVFAGVWVRPIPHLEDGMDRLEDLIGYVCSGSGPM